jgi:hypothetical protein
MSRADVAPAMASPEKNHKGCIIYCKGQSETLELQNPDYHHADSCFRDGVTPRQKRRVDFQAAKQEEESYGN